ncbi:hypothetical protein EAI_10071 [Harpegnathos saltator]|uniref:C2H2-type domain-containing protein n=1 Tax=Harpegnathos saltator TaxID=610380 RepID=E2BJD2_HARSA|nr:hypothetical protein EAI_10071 [Harpegnathos saltator]
MFLLLNHLELCDWLAEPLVKQEIDISESCFDFVSTDYNELSPETWDVPKKKLVNIAPLRCEECGKSFSRNDSLKRHEKLYCKVKSKVKCCRYCGEQFNKPDFLRDHINSAHASEIKPKSIKEEPK